MANELITRASSGFGSAVVSGSIEVEGLTPSESTAEGNPVQVGGIYTAAGRVLTDGDVAALGLTVNGFLQTAEQFAPNYEDQTNGIALVGERALALATYDGSVDINMAATLARAVKASAGNVFAAYGANFSAAVVHLAFVNKATPPVNADPIVGWMTVANNQNGFILGRDFFRMMGKHFTIGVAACWSTTLGTVTLAGAATDLHWWLRYA